MLPLQSSLRCLQEIFLDLLNGEESIADSEFYRMLKTVGPFALSRLP